jgi:hypothetical protein
MCSPDFSQKIAILDGFAVPGAPSAIADADAIENASSARIILILPFAENARRIHFFIIGEPLMSGSSDREYGPHHLISDSLLATCSIQGA